MILSALGLGPHEFTFEFYLKDLIPMEIVSILINL